MPYIELTKNIFDCSVCETRCDGKSKLNYQFLKDVEFAEQQEKIIIDNSKKIFGHNAVKTSTDGYPDLGPMPSLGIPHWCYTMDTVITDHLEGTKYSVRDYVEGRVDDNGHLIKKTNKRN